MRALVCVVFSLCIALFLPASSLAQDLFVPHIPSYPLLFDGFLFTPATVPGPISLVQTGIAAAPPDSVITGEVFIGIIPSNELSAGIAGLVPGLAPLTTADFAKNGSLFNQADHVLLKYALMVDADPSDLNDPSLYHFINQWYGVRYKWGGTTNLGIDCSALSQKMYGTVYNVSIRRTSKQQYRHSDHFKKYTEAEEGDLVFFRIKRLRISHVGIYLANGYFVHASRTKGVMISNLAEKYWKRRYAGCGRIIHEVREDMESAFAD